MAEEIMDAPETEEVETSEGVLEGYTGQYPELAAHYKSGKDLTDDELDTIADISIDVVRSILASFDADSCTIDEYDGDDGELILDVSGADLAVLIGRHGRTLESLQTLVSLIVSRRLGFRFPVVVDIEGYKSRRRDKVRGMAHSAANRAVRQGNSVSLPPMTAYERRLVHLALRDDDRVMTHSEGMDPDRRVVVVPLAED